MLPRPDKLFWGIERINCRQVKRSTIIYEPAVCTHIMQYNSLAAQIIIGLQKTSQTRSKNFSFSLEFIL